LLDSVEEFVYDDNICELMTDDLMDAVNENDDDGKMSQVFADAVIVTYENEEGVR
jgi:hypothetical protein